MSKIVLIVFSFTFVLGITGRGDAAQAVSEPRRVELGEVGVVHLPRGFEHQGPIVGGGHLTEGRIQHQDREMVISYAIGPGEGGHRLHPEHFHLLDPEHYDYAWYSEQVIGERRIRLALNVAGGRGPFLLATISRETRRPEATEARSPGPPGTTASAGRRLGEPPQAWWLPPSSSWPAHFTATSTSERDIAEALLIILSYEPR